MLSAEFRRSVGEVIHRGVPLLFGCGYAGLGTGRKQLPGFSLAAGRGCPDPAPRAALGAGLPTPPPEPRWARVSGHPKLAIEEVEGMPR